VGLRARVRSGWGVAVYALCACGWNGDHLISELEHGQDWMRIVFHAVMAIGGLGYAIYAFRKGLNPVPANRRPQHRRGALDWIGNHNTDSGGPSTGLEG
jgi:hypothetical protein